MGDMKYWTTKEFKTVKDNLHLTDREIGLLIGRETSKVKAFRDRYRMLKSPEQQHFQKGMKPWNKGIKYDGGCKDTRFKPGQLPPNTKHDGCITIRYGNSRPYYYIRLAMSKWKLLHRHIWEQQKGEIPKGYIIIFKDKNSLNCDINNLMCISRREHVKMNANRKKAGKSLRLNWEYCRRKEELGIRTTRHHQIKRYDDQPINWQSGISQPAHALAQ